MDACKTEDQMNCIWNASEAGNGTGQSFVDIDGTQHDVADPTVIHDTWYDVDEYGNGIHFEYDYVMDVHGEMVVLDRGEIVTDGVAVEPAQATETTVVGWVPEEPSLAVTGAGTGVTLALVSVALLALGAFCIHTALKRDRKRQG